jgi:hypothetical protein
VPLPRIALIVNRETDKFSIGNKPLIKFVVVFLRIANEGLTPSSIPRLMAANVE